MDRDPDEQVVTTSMARHRNFASVGINSTLAEKQPGRLKWKGFLAKRTLNVISGCLRIPPMRPNAEQSWSCLPRKSEDQGGNRAKGRQCTSRQL